jgi:hypothetical protein
MAGIVLLATSVVARSSPSVDAGPSADAVLRPTDLSPASYVFTDLGPHVSPKGIDDAGNVVVQMAGVYDPVAHTTPPETAALWIDGLTYPLVPPTGSTRTLVSDISNSGLISGSTAVPGGLLRATTWTTTNRFGTVLPSAPDGSLGSYVNDAGQVLSSSYVGGVLPLSWSDVTANPVSISTADGTPIQTVCGLTSAGAIVGSSYLNSASHYYVLPSPGRPGIELDLTLGCSSGVGSVSPNGTIIGVRAGPNGSSVGVVRAPDGTETTLPDGFHPDGVNDRGVVVGGRNGASGEQGIGAIWENGQLADTTSLAPANWLIVGPQAINAEGDIIGFGTVQGESYAHGFVLQRKQTLDISGVTINPAQPTVNDPSVVGSIVLRNNTSDTLTDVSAVVTTTTPATVSITSAPAPATVASLAPGASTTFTFTLQPLASGPASLSVAASGTDGGTTANAQPRTRTFTVGDPGLAIGLAGSVVELGKTFGIRMTITNTGADEVDNITWGVPTGLSVEPGDNPPDPLSNVLQTSGPDQALPTTLAPGQTAVILYTFSAPAVGTSVILARADGTTATTHKAVSGDAAVSIVVAGTWTEEQRDQLAIAGINTGLAQLSQQLLAQDASLSNLTRTTIGFDDPTVAQVTAVDQLGIARPGFDALVANAATSGKDQLIALLTNSAGGLAKAADRFGTSTAQAGLNLYNAIADPERRQQVAAAIWKYAKTVPASAWNNRGYLSEALDATQTIDGLKNIYNDNATLLNSVTTAVGQAASGAPTLLANYARQYGNDPVKAMANVGDFIGDTLFTGFHAGATAVLGEVGMAGFGLSVNKILPTGGLGLFTRGGAIDASLVGTADVVTAGASDARATESLVLRNQQAQAVVDNYQALPVGTVLDATTMTGKAGLLSSDATTIQSIITAADRKFGTNFAVSMRTSEPLSVGIDGIAKPEFIKPKAVSLLDQMIGADPARAGKVSLFNPLPMDAAVISDLERAYPGFAARYEERLATQQKLWAEWSSRESSLELLTNAGARYKDSGGITILNARPGNPVPYGLKYLQQLDEAEFLTANGIDPAQVPEIKQQILASNIDTYQAAPIATVSRSGSVFIDDALTGKPFISDADIQSVHPVNGSYPPNVTKSQVETFFKAQFQKLERFPFHGWSDAVIDLPSDAYIAAIPFQLGTAEPALAAQAADLVAGRLQSLENIAIAKAARLTVAGDTAAASKVLEPYQKLAAFKDPNTGLYSSTRLLKKFPPGEKTINFTAGDIRVGHGTGGH